MSASPLEVASAWSVAEGDEHRRPDRDPQDDRQEGDRADDPAGQAARHRIGQSVRFGGGGRRGRRGGGSGSRRRFAGRRHEPVADAAHGLDLRSVGAELAADLADMDIDGPRLTREVRAPDVLEQTVAGQDDAGVPGERREEIELAGAEAEVAAGDRRLAAARIDPERADLDRAPAAGRRVRPAQDRLDPGDERPRVERLRDVVVGAELETDDRVDVVVPGGEHQDRGVAAPPDLAADLEAVELRQHQVEDHEIRVVASMAVEAPRRRRGLRRPRSPPSRGTAGPGRRCGARRRRRGSSSRVGLVGDGGGRHAAEDTPRPDGRSARMSADRKAPRQPAGQRSRNTVSSRGRRASPAAVFGRRAASVGWPSWTTVRTIRSSGRPRIAAAAGRTSSRIQLIPAPMSRMAAATRTRSATRPSS